MKKIFFAALAAMLCITACNDARQKNLEANDAITKAFETGDTSKIDTYVAKDFIDHTDQGDKVGPDSLKAMVNMVHTSFKDMKTEKIHEVADDDFVFSWVKYTGTSDGSMGMAKGPYTMAVVEVSKFKDGKAIEHWAFMDMKTMMMMMPPPPPPMEKKDTAK